MRLSLAANLSSRDGTLTKDSLVTNGFVEMRGKEAVLIKRGGLNLVCDLGAGPGQGMTNFVDLYGNEVLYAIQNGTFYLANVFAPGLAFTEMNPPSLVGNDVSKAGMQSFGGYLWALGGESNSTAVQSIFYKQNATDAAWTLGASDALSGSMSAWPALVVAGATMYALGGISTNGAFATQEVYSTSDGVTWSLLTAAAAFTGQYASRVLYFNGYLWLLGGVLISGAATNKIYKSVDGITWTLVNTTPSWGDAEGGAAVRIFFAAMVMNGKMMVLGGYRSGAYRNDIWSSTDGVTWTQETAAAAWGIRAYHAVVNLGGFAILVGGFNGSGLLDEWSSPDGVTWTSVGATSGITDGRLVLTLGVAGIVHASKMVVNEIGGPSARPTTSSAGGTSLGTLALAPGDLADFSKNLDGTQIMFKGPLAGYKMVVSTQVISQITDPQYPVRTVRGCPYLDGTFYVMEPDGTIWGSALEDCSTWTDDNFISAEFEPDQGVCLSKYNNYIVALGQWTTQLFWDAANPTGSPLSPVQNGVMLIGCAHANSVAQIESTLLYIAQRKGQGASFQKGRFIAMLEGSSYVQVSTPDVDRILDLDDLSVVYSCVGSLGGHNFYILSLADTGVSLVYDLMQKLWYVWTRCATGTAVTLTSLTQSNGLATATKAGHGFADGDPITLAGANQAGYNLTNVNVTVVSSSVFTYPVAAATVSPATGTVTATPVTESYFNMVASCNYQNQQVFQESTGGGIYQLLDTVFQDDGVVINWKARSGKQDSGNNENKFCGMVEPIGDLYSGTGLIRCNDADYAAASWTYYRRHDMSDQRPASQRWGKYRRRGWEWRYTGNTRGRLEGLEIEGEGIAPNGGKA